MTESSYSQTIETYDLMNLYFQASHSESSLTPAVELFSKNSQRVKVVGYFCKRVPSWTFYRILNVSLPNNFLQLEEGLRKSLPLQGLH